VAGPVLAGVLIYWLDFAVTFRLMAAILLLGATVVWLSGRYARKLAPDEEVVPA
jgi:hypothetical protein